MNIEVIINGINRCIDKKLEEYLKIIKLTPDDAEKLLEYQDKIKPSALPLIRRIACFEIKNTERKRHSR